MENKIKADNMEVHDFTLDLVDRLFDEGIVNNKEDIPDNITEMVIGALRETMTNNN